MGAINLAEWQKLPISLSELCINTTLRCGQTFRWRKSDSGVWSIALHNRILSLHQDPEHLYYRSFPPGSSLAQAPPTPPSSKPPSLPDANSDEETLELIKNYFNLTPNLTELYDFWSTNDKNFAAKAPKFTGIRILKQDAWEALIGFICSSNNNIARISQMVHKLCIHYGPLIGHLDEDGNLCTSTDDAAEAYHDFPTPQALAQNGVESNLRALGFGYRAKYIHQTAQIVASKPSGWLDSLRNPESPTVNQKPSSAGDFSAAGREGYRTAHEELLALQGVGPKVADCVCLMGLGWGEAVPVDTHVWQIAQRDYKFGKGKHASLTKQTYDAIGEKFRELWGKEAGWAQSVLFTANLRAFSERLVAKKEEVVEEDVQVKREDGEMKVEDVVKTEKVVEKAIKREHEEDEKKVFEVEEKVVRSKRRRRN